MRPVVFAAPFPLEATMRFARGAARIKGIKLLGVMQEPPKGNERRLFDDIVRVPDGLSTRDVIAGIDVLRSRHGHPHRIIGVLEPLQVQLALARQHFGVPGTDPDTADLFRDKARMKDRLRAAGLPVARHRLLASSHEGEGFAREVGFPIVLKPPAGMGAKATFRVRSIDELRGGVAGMGASRESPVLAEEFLQGQEGSFDTITCGGVPQVASISDYFPTPLAVLENPWVQWCCLLPRSIDGAEHAEVKRIGVRAIAALGLRDGFTHREWFRRTDGSIAIGEIAQRPPGANITRMIGLAHDIDPYLAWARAVIDGEFDGPWERRWSVGCAYIRGMGRGRISAVTGVEETHDRVGKWVVEAKLPNVGAQKNDGYEGDGYAIVRGPTTSLVHEALTKIIEGVRVHYA